MPIYAYRCDACGHSQDILQKISDPVLTTCPACGAVAFAKQVTAAGFQLKGSGWYVTDFRGGNGGAKKDEAKDEAKADAKPDAPAEAKPAEPKSTESKSEAAAPAPAPTPAPAPPPASS
jgi:putative FmdB family regulatory protein